MSNKDIDNLLNDFPELQIVGNSLPCSAVDVVDAKKRGYTVATVKGGIKVVSPNGPKLLLSTNAGAGGALRWKFKVQGNSSWSVGVISDSEKGNDDALHSNGKVGLDSNGLLGGTMRSESMHNKTVIVTYDVSSYEAKFWIEGQPVIVQRSPRGAFPSTVRLALSTFNGCEIELTDDITSDDLLGCALATNRLSVGDRVKLSPNYAKYGDAGGGPLTPSDEGTLVEDDGSSKPYRVRAADGRAWWYHAEAIVPAGGRNNGDGPGRAGGGACAHEFVNDVCMICTACGFCTGYGRRCVHCVAGARPAEAGGPCGCGGGDSGCRLCGRCRGCGSSSAAVAAAPGRAIGVGDAVRVRASVDSPAYGWGGLEAKAHACVGFVTSASESDSDCEVDFPEHSGWKGKAAEMEVVEGAAAAEARAARAARAAMVDRLPIKVGCRVRVKASVAKPKFEWGGLREAKHKAVGTVVRIRDGDKCDVDFPEQQNWTGLIEEMEIVADGTGQSAEAAKAPASASPIKVGCRVRVKASVAKPKFEWGGLIETKHKSVGTVVKIRDGDKCDVDFPEQKSWTGLLEEMEVVADGTGKSAGAAVAAASTSSIKVGCRVRVKASVAKPKFEWGGLIETKHKSVGTVVKIRDGDKCDVDFPEQKSWTGLLEEMEIVEGAAAAASQRPPSGLKVGDKVRVKPSVATPKYNWGEVSHASVGTLKKVDSDGDGFVCFPEHSNWCAPLDELELAPPAAVAAAAAAGKPKFAVGDKVQLSKTYAEHADAGSGPLKPGDVGTVDKFDPKDSTYLVKNSSGSEWWYKGAALTPQGSAAAAAPAADTLKSSPSPQAPVPLKAAAPPTSDGRPSLAKSKFKSLYRAAKLPDDDLELLTCLKKFIRLFCQANGLPEATAGKFMDQLRREALEADRNAAVEEMLSDVPRYAQRLWTSQSILVDGTLSGIELCTMINQAIRKDDEALLEPLAPVIRAINALSVCSRAIRAITPDKWPMDGLCYRGGALPDEHQKFFQPGVKYRVPGYLATSFEKDVAQRFSMRAFHSSEGASPVVMWTIKVDPRGRTDPTKRCMQVNYVASSNFGETEQEFLFAPYSPFTVEQVEWSSTPNYVTPHRITLVAALDSLIESEDLPIAPWY